MLHEWPDPYIPVASWLFGVTKSHDSEELKNTSWFNFHNVVMGVQINCLLSYMHAY